jgi:xanthine dehydrogenase accessory factor
MREILRHLDAWQRQSQEIALATVVAVSGSAPRPSGARLLVTRSGRMAGSVSGGCVENDVYERALRVLDADRPALVRYSGSDEEWSFEVGLACGGAIEVLIEPFAADAAWGAVREALEDDRSAALCLALEPESLRGRRLAVLEAGVRVGGIDAALDAAAAAAAEPLLAAGGSATVETSWRGGPAKLFVEAFPRPLHLFIVGATHTAMPLCRMAALLGYRVHVIDARSIFATEERFPEAAEVLRAWPDEALVPGALDSHAHVVTLTHDPKFDLPALAQALRSEAGYIGALGSRRTHQRRLERLREQGFDEAQLARIHTPVGLDLGARTPEEIALSILAEMLAARCGRDGRNAALPFMATPDAPVRARASGIVLAAGTASRMGGLKALLPLGDRCLLQHVVDAALASCLDEVIVVLGHRADEVRSVLAIPEGGRARVVVNADFAAGQSASLRCGLRAASPASETAAVLLGDQPTVSAARIDRVAAAFFASQRPAARPVFPEAGGAPGHPVFLARRLWPLLEAETGDRGARELLAAHPDWLTAVPESGAPPPDLDTPDDYEAAARAAMVPDAARSQAWGGSGEKDSEGH